MILYETYSFISTIEEVEAIKFTEKSVWLANSKGRQKKHSDWLNYWETYEEAEAHLMGECKRRLKHSEERVCRELAILEELEKL